jgi:hypothetical protein
MLNMFPPQTKKLNLKNKNKIKTKAIVLGQNWSIGAGTGVAECCLFINFSYSSHIFCAMGSDASFAT